MKIISVIHYNKNIHVHGLQMGNYTHLVDKFSPLVRDVDLGSSMTADKLTHELCNPFRGLDSGHLLGYSMAVIMVSYPSSVGGRFVMQSMPSYLHGILGTGMDFSFSSPFSNFPPHFTHRQGTQLLM